MPARRKEVPGSRSIVEVEADYEHQLREFRSNGGRLKCDGKPELYSDYEHYLGRPSPQDARALCAGCPFFEQCGEYAEATRPGHGIWAGIVWRDGRPIRREPIKPLEEIAD